jgi:chromosome segregation ATPase
MKAYSLTKMITFVSIIFMACAGWGQTPAGSTPSYPYPGYDAQNSCDQALNSVRSSWASALTLCKNSGSGRDLKTCGETLRDCADSRSDEQAITPSSAEIANNPTIASLFAFDGGTTSRCSDYTRSEYDSKERDIKREVRETRKDLSDAQKQKATDLETLNKELASIDEKMQTAQEEKVTQDLAYDEEQRKKAEAREQSEAELDKAINAKEMEILDYQNAVKAKILARQNQINQYRIDILKCKLEAEEFGAKRSQANTKAKGAGGLNSAASTGQSRNQILKDLFDTCVTGILNRRTSEGEAYRADIERLNKAIGQFQTTLAQMRQNKQNAAQRNAEADAKEKDAKAKKDQLDLQKQQSLLSQKGQAFQVYQERVKRNMDEIGRAQGDVNQSSNDLSQFQRAKPKGKNSASEAQESVDKYDADKGACQRLCSAYPEKLKGCFPEGPTSATKKEAPAGAADGHKGP